MKKIRFRIVFICVALLAATQNQVYSDDENQIKWSKDNKLSYSDFQASVPKNTYWAALTSSKIYFSFQSFNDKLTSFSVYASFNPERSWIKNKIPKVLEHERLHFDITEVYARKLYKELQTTALGFSSSEAKKIFTHINSEWGIVQDEYDLETDHGVKTVAQEEWVQKVAAWLEEYEPYPAVE